MKWSTAPYCRRGRGMLRSVGLLIASLCILKLFHLFTVRRTEIWRKKGTPLCVLCMDEIYYGSYSCTPFSFSSALIWANAEQKSSGSAKVGMHSQKQPTAFTSVLTTEYTRWRSGADNHQHSKETSTPRCVRPDKPNTIEKLRVV